MSLITINDVTVLNGTISMPLTGVWSADLVIDQPDGTGFDAGTVVTISTDGLDLSGTVVPDRTGDFLDAIHVRVLGGKAGMAKQTTPASLVQPGAFVRDVLNSLMSDSGESLSSTIDAGFLATNLTAWSIMSMPVARALTALLDVTAPQSGWRFLPGGALWIGEESWPSSDAEYTLIESNPADRSAELGVDAPNITPGVQIELGKVARVEHQIMPNTIRSRVWFDLPRDDRGIQASITAMVKAATASIDYLAYYEATVKSQSADYTTLDVAPTDQRLAGLSRISLRNGVPGMTSQVQSGAKIMLGFKGGDPSQPYVHSWGGGETVVRLTLTANNIILNNGTNHVIRVGDSTSGHVHVESGNAGPYPIVGSTQSATDTMAENGGTVAAG